MSGFSRSISHYTTSGYKFKGATVRLKENFSTKMIEAKDDGKTSLKL